MANTSGMTRRAAMHQQQEKEERAKRNRRILGAVLGAVALVVVAIVTVVIVQSIGDDQESSANQQTPPNATAESGIMVTSQDAEAVTDAPRLVLYEDYQCPACAMYEETYAAPTMELVDSGAITLEIRTAHFLDGMLQNDSSERAALGAAAADQVGKYREYHAAVYENQPSEGAGYTDQQLRVDFAAQAGITGEDLTTFQELFDAKAFQDFVDASDKTFVDEGISGTPTYMVGDTKLEFTNDKNEVVIEPTAEDLLRAINEANN